MEGRVGESESHGEAAMAESKKRRFVRGRVNGAPPHGGFSTLKLNYSFEKCGGEL